MPFEVKVRFNMAEFQRALAAAPEIMDGHFERASIEVIAQLEARVKDLIASRFGDKGPAVAYGTLVNSVYSETHGAPSYGGIVGVNPPADSYAAPVEEGTRPHFPPPNALYGWVKRKLGLTDEKEIRGVAFVIARAIARRGTKGHHAFERAVQIEHDPIIQRYQLALDDAMREVFGGTS